MEESPAWLAPSDEETRLLVVITESGLEKKTDLQMTYIKVLENNSLATRPVVTRPICQSSFANATLELQSPDIVQK